MPTRKEIELYLRPAPRRATLLLTEEVHECKHCHWQFIVYARSRGAADPFKSMEGVVVCPYCGWREGTEHEYFEYKIPSLVGADAEQAIKAIDAFLQKVRLVDAEKGKGNNLVHIADLRQHFTDAQIAAWIDHLEYVENGSGWDPDGLSSSESTDLAWVTGHVNTLIYTPRRGLVSYLYYRRH